MTIKNYRTLKEVSNDLNEEEHTIRFWISRFKEIPLNQFGDYQKRKFFSNQDFENLRKIKILLKDNKYTIEGAIKSLSNKNSINNSKSIMVNRLKTVSKNIKNLINP